MAILDCCYAGLAAEERGRLSSGRPIPLSGSYLMMSSGGSESSWYETDSPNPQTYFTKLLLDTVDTGIPGRPAGLTLRHLFSAVADRLDEIGKPEPRASANDHAADWVFARNNTADEPRSRIEPDADPDASYRAAYRRESEEGIEALHHIAAAYRAAAAAGNTASMNRLGLIAEGRIQARMQGLAPSAVDPKALPVAVHWYTMAAEAGDPVGAFHLGRLYEEEFGDADQARYWYDLAANQGNGAARERIDGLEQRLALGLGLKRAVRDPAPLPPQPAPAPQGSTLNDLATATLQARWLRDWGGNSPRAIAECLDELATACGGAYGEWGMLTDTEQQLALGDFLASRPPRATLAREALSYYEAAGPSNLRAHVKRLAD